MPDQMLVPVAHDFNCPWCWVGLFQVKRLKVEFGVKIEWRGHELLPEEMDWPAPRPPELEPPNRPPILSRFEFLKVIEGIEVPKIERPKQMHTHNAHEAVEYFKEHAPDQVDAFVEAVYRAYWEQGQRIGDSEVLERLARPLLSEANGGLAKAITERRYKDKITPFDAASYRAGVYHVPTFFIGEKRYAEMPYSILERAMKEVAPAQPEHTFYADLEFPAAPPGRPYVAINMVATIDGKILSGNRDEPVVDLGSKLDHELMKRIEGAMDAVLLGAQTLRAAKKSWNPATKTRIVLTRSGHLEFDSCFFTGHPVIASPVPLSTPEGVENLVAPDLATLLGELRNRGIEHLLVL